MPNRPARRASAGPGFAAAGFSHVDQAAIMASLSPTR